MQKAGWTWAPDANVPRVTPFCKGKGAWRQPSSPRFLVSCHPWPMEVGPTLHPVTHLCGEPLSPGLCISGEELRLCPHGLASAA